MVGAGIQDLPGDDEVAIGVHGHRGTGVSGRLGDDDLARLGLPGRVVDAGLDVVEIIRAQMDLIIPGDDVIAVGVHRDRGHGLVQRRGHVDLRVAGRDGDEAQDEPLLQRFQPGPHIPAGPSGSILISGRNSSRGRFIGSPS